MSFLGLTAYLICIGQWTPFREVTKSGRLSDKSYRLTLVKQMSSISNAMVKKRLGGGVNKCGCPLPSAACSSVKFMLPLQSFSCQVSSTADPFLQTPATHCHDVFHLWEVRQWNSLPFAPETTFWAFVRNAYFPNVLGVESGSKILVTT